MAIPQESEHCVFANEELREAYESTRTAVSIDSIHSAIERSLAPPKMGRKNRSKRRGFTRSSVTESESEPLSVESTGSLSSQKHQSRIPVLSSRSRVSASASSVTGSLASSVMETASVKASRIPRPIVMFLNRTPEATTLSATEETTTSHDLAKYSDHTYKDVVASLPYVALETLVSPSHNQESRAKITATMDNVNVTFDVNLAFNGAPLHIEGVVVQ
ncbi:unnamed protein product [Caenorhabditis auriculariae]|uniref:Uncharacterized protein n=1 Tax=Caenorhabditis auriculariae TaxID=2777116 RepID=A0A8S1GQ75_9PELO|nr:unnamed protein product [Caenorhabditis auriculariae]